MKRKIHDKISASLKQRRVITGASPDAHYKPRSIFTARLLLIVSLFLFAAGTAFGQAKTVTDLSSPVSPGSSAAYSDLLKLLFPDLSADTGSATRTVPVRLSSRKYKPISIHGDFKIDSLEAIQVRDPRGPRLVIELDIATDDDTGDVGFAGAAGIVAAFQISPSLRLLDALEVKTDRFTGFDEPALVPISENQSAFLISNSHSNSEQSYQLISAFFMANNRLQPVFTTVFPRRRKIVQGDDLFLLSDRDFDEKTNCLVTTEESANFFPIRQPGNTYFKIGVKVKVTTTVEGDECRSPRHHSRYFRGAWAWDSTARRFRPSAGNLDLLDAFNEKRM
jgi:hypothetical protein